MRSTGEKDEEDDRSRQEGRFRAYHPAGDDELYNVLMIALIDKYERGDISLDDLLRLRSRLKDHME
jgi:hypothetical protein